MTIRHAATAVLMAAAVGLVARAQPPVAVPKNVVPSTFRAQLVVDDRFKDPVTFPDGTKGPDPRNRTGKIHCLVCENGLAPVVAVFVRAETTDAKVEPGLTKLLKGTEALLPKYRADKMAAFATFLSLDGGQKLVKLADGTEKETDKEYPDDEKRDAKAKDVKDYAAKTATPGIPFGLAGADSKALKEFAIGDEPVTVIIYNRLRIVNRWALKADDLTDEKLAEILNATQTMITGTPAKK
jgi:hypothetical protein